VYTGRGFERLVNFSDAVVAIAVTLLVLPLVELPRELTAGQDVGDLWTEHVADFTAFFISFVVIWSLWLGHHGTMEYFRAYDHWLIRWHMLWLLTIVVLPFSTELISITANESGAVPLYIGTLLLSSVSLLGMALHGRRRTELLHAGSAEVAAWLGRSVSFYNTAVMVLAFGLSLVAPAVGLWSLLLLLLDNVVEGLVARMRRRRPSESATEPPGR
jgi:uncharacterized membrane protein